MVTPPSSSIASRSAGVGLVELAAVGAHVVEVDGEVDVAVADRADVVAAGAADGDAALVVGGGRRGDVVERGRDHVLGALAVDDVRVGGLVGLVLVEDREDDGDERDDGDDEAADREDAVPLGLALLLLAHLRGLGAGFVAAYCLGGTRVVGGHGCSWYVGRAAWTGWVRLSGHAPADPVARCCPRAPAPSRWRRPGPAGGAAGCGTGSGRAARSAPRRARPTSSRTCRAARTSRADRPTPHAVSRR